MTEIDRTARDGIKVTEGEMSIQEQIDYMNAMVDRWHQRGAPGREVAKVIAIRDTLEKLMSAIDVLCEVHTRDGVRDYDWSVQMGAMPERYGGPPNDIYVDAWRTLRQAIGRQV